MYIVKAYHHLQPGFNGPFESSSETESGPFETREEAARFATGLAKAGQCYKAEIIPYEYSPDSALTHAAEAYNAAQRLLSDTPKYQTAYITEAMETISKAIGYLRSHKELTNGS